jgi:hypothetical protein
MKLQLTSRDNYIEVEAHDLDLEVPCPQQGCVAGKMQGGNCTTCEGRGYVLTPMGLHILAFVIKNAAWFRAKQKKHHG